MHVQRLCLWAATLWTDQGNLSGVGLGRVRAWRTVGTPCAALAGYCRIGGRRCGWVDQPIYFPHPFGAFLLVLVSLTAVIWVTQALHDFDLVTSQGQTILVFMGITGLIIPLLVLVIAPIALLIATAHALNKLSTDREIIVMNAAGMSPWLCSAPSSRWRWWCRSASRRSTPILRQGLRMLRDC